MNEPVAHPQSELLAHAGFVRALARATLRGDSECEDLEQDVWRAALEAGPVEPARQRPWLVAVLRRKAVDVLRRRDRRSRRERAAAVPEAQVSAADAVVRAESGRRLVAALLDLEEPYRSAVLLRYLDELPPRAVAARLGIPVETVRSRVRRGLERLRVRLGEQERGEERARQMLRALVGPGIWIPWSFPVLGGSLVAKKIAVAAVLLLAVGGAAWIVVAAVASKASTDLQDPPRLAGLDGEAAQVALAAAPTRGPQRDAGGVRGSPGAALPTTPPVDAAGLARPAPPPDATSRVIHGQVVSDTGVPIAGALVQGAAYRPTRGGPPFLMSPDSIRWPMARTDDAGRFEISIPESTGRYMLLRATAKGWSMPSERMSGGVQAHPGVEVTLALKPSASLDAAVLDDATGQPIVGALVESFRSRTYSLYMLSPDAQATTGVDGHAELQVLGGPTRVLASAAGFAQGEGESPSVDATGGAVSIRLRRGGTVVADVFDPAGRAIEGARVALLRAPGVHLRGTSDTNGRARFDHVPALGVGVPGIEALSLVLVAAEAEGFVRSWAEADAPAEGAEVHVRIDLGLPRTLRGRVILADGAPASGTKVQGATAVGRGYAWGWGGLGVPVTATADVQGEFELQGVSPGQVSVWAGESQSDATAVHVDVPPQGEVPTVEVRVTPVQAPIRVRILGADGRPVSGAGVRLIAAGQNSGGTLLTKADGMADLQPRVPGPWWLFVGGPGMGPLARRLDAAEAARGPVEVRPGAERVEGSAVRLDGSPARVRLALQRTIPLPNLNVHEADYQGAVDTDAVGHFVFVGVSEGVDGITCITEGWRLLPGLYVAVTERSRDLRLTVIDEAESASLHLEVEVVDAATGAAPVGAVNVLATQKNGAASQSPFAVIGTRTVYRTAGPLAPGTWHVRVDSKGYEVAESDVTLVAGRPAPRPRLLLRRKG